jgi:hypothetical protein
MSALVLTDLHAFDPLDPLQTAASGNDEAKRIAVTGRERLAADVRREQCLADLVEPERPRVLGNRDDAHA